MTTARQAFAAMYEVVERGSKFTHQDAFPLADQTHTEIIGRGFKLTHELTVPINCSTVTVDVDLLLLVPEGASTLRVVTTLAWQSVFGSHMAQSDFHLDDRVITNLERAGNTREMALEEYEAHFQATFGGLVLSQDAVRQVFGFSWTHQLPQGVTDPATDETMNDHHNEVIVTAIEAHPDLLVLMTPNELAAPEETDVTELYTLLFHYPATRSAFA